MSGRAFDKNVCLIEYAGCMPDTLSVHGNQKKVDEEYIRSSNDVMSEMNGLLGHVDQPKKVYDKLVRRFGDLEGPRSIRQVRDLAYRARKLS